MPTQTGSTDVPFDLVLHIGTGKTGTSSVQALLHRNRELLSQAGYLYPRSPGTTRQARFSLMLKSDDEILRDPARRRFGVTDPAKFRARFPRRLEREMREAGLSRVIISDEGLYSSSAEVLHRLRAFTDKVADSVRVVVYLRRQDDHLISLYQQVVKQGEVRRLSDWLHQQDLANTFDYDYHRRLRMWQELLAPAEIVVRRFERDHFVDGSLYQDFLSAAGIAVRLEDLVEIDARNESLDAESVELLRLVNVLRLEHEGLQAPSGNRPLVVRLRETELGPALTLPEPTLDEFMARWATSNRAVAEEYFGDRGGELFAAPRRTRNTTTDQFFDPARLDHFLTLLDLPEEMHAPLRGVVEREAARR